MGNRKGIIYAALERLDALMAIGTSRREAKQAAREAGEPAWAFTTGKIHSYQTRTTYQQQILTFIDWARETHGINRLERLDERADELATAYLSERITQGYSPWTLLTQRSALRLFFSNPELAADVDLPRRTRERITRSRQPAVRDQDIQPEHWQPLINFVLATGLRREELRDLLVRDIFRDAQGQLVVEVRRGKGGKVRRVEVFPGREDAVMRLVEGREPQAHVCERLPGSLDIHALRRQFAQELYMYYSGRPLPSPEGRLDPKEVDREAARKVSEALGHHRVDIIFTHYIR